MPKVVCKKCGATGHSKCPSSRNVFLDNQDLAAFESTMPTWIQPEKDQENGMLHLRRIVFADDTAQSVLEDVVRIMQYVIDNGWARQFVCLHEFVMAPGETCIFGCCHSEAES